jgi:type I restriction-modification system DNA methylase subunit
MLKKLVKTATNNRQILEGNFKAYLDGFSDNVKEIISKFDLRNQIREMVEADVLLDVLEKFTSPYINLSPHDVKDPDGRRFPGLSNLGMGYVFEEPIRKFNEENNEAGEHFTPREVIKLMTHLLFIPIQRNQRQRAGISVSQRPFVLYRQCLSQIPSLHYGFGDGDGVMSAGLYASSMQTPTSLE